MGTHTRLPELSKVIPSPLKFRFQARLRTPSVFRGIVDGDRDEISGTSELKGGGGFLGHAGEVDEPDRPWTATKGLKRPNNKFDKRPDDDDDR
jgi:hypothetical protein